jgi:hypothetical protein
MSFIQQLRPDVVSALEELERTTADLNGSGAAKEQRKLIYQLHPDISLSDASELSAQIRERRWQQLGLL